MKAFLNRLDIERNALKHMNKVFNEPQLCGLTEKAIEQWYTKHPECDEEIYRCLISVSKSVRALSDRSGERFDERYLADSSKSKEAVIQLMKLLESR